MRKFLIVIMFSLFAMVFFCNGEKIKAIDYDKVCDESILAINGRTYKKCGTNYIYLIDEKSKSSHFVSSLETFSDAQTLYAGKVDGIDTFYSKGFHYFSVIYDNRELGNSNYDYWSDIVHNNVLIYDGEFKDTWLIDQSEIKPVILYDIEGTYLIRQYKGKKITDIIKIIIPSRNDSGIEIEKVMYGDKEVGKSTLVGNSSNLFFKISGGEYGFNKNVLIDVNECSFNVNFSNNLYINNSEFKKCLSYNVSNNISITISNGFNIDKTFKYSFKLNSNNVSIKLEDSVSAIETSSRRVLIKAYPGSGKNLSDECNLYYWSKDPNHILTYENFMKNYVASPYKGTYSSNKGVILRDAVGTYYLYAMARDDDSIVVVRSDEYVLKKKKKLNKVIMNDVIFVLGLCVLGVIPIIVYLVIRGKDTD